MGQTCKRGFLNSFVRGKKTTRKTDFKNQMAPVAKPVKKASLVPTEVFKIIFSQVTPFKNFKTKSKREEKAIPLYFLGIFLLLISLGSETTCCLALNNLGKSML